MQVIDATEQTIAELHTTIHNLERALEDQIQWLKDMLPEISALQVRNGGMNEFIIESLQSGAQSRGFTMVISNCPRVFLSDLEVDISRYVTLDSPVFDIIMTAGYKPERLRNLDHAIQSIFKFNYCLPYMPMWRVIVPRISKLARDQRVANVDWIGALRAFNTSCSSSRDYVLQHPDHGAWSEAVRELRDAMAAAQVSQID